MCFNNFITTSFYTSSSKDTMEKSKRPTTCVATKKYQNVIVSRLFCGMHDQREKSKHCVRASLNTTCSRFIKKLFVVCRNASRTVDRHRKLKSVSPLQTKINNLVCGITRMVFLGHDDVVGLLKCFPIG